MADAPNTATQPTNAPASQPTAETKPEPETKPASPEPKPESKPEPDPALKRETAVETKVPESLDKKLRIEVDGGPDEGVSLAELVTNYQKTGTLSEKALEVAKLVQGADQKDPKSILGLFGLNPDGTDPNAEPDPAGSPATGTEGEKIAALERRVDEQAAFIGEIAGVRDQVQLRKAITQFAEKLPMLATDPRRGAEDVQKQLTEIDSIMRMNNPAYDPGKLTRDEQKQRFEAAFVRAENGLLDVVQRYNPNFKPTTKDAKAVPPPVGATDDQPAAGEKSNSPDVLPATMNFVNGQFINQEGKSVRQTATGEVVPQNIPDPAAASAAAVPPAGPAANQGGASFREQRMQTIRARRQEMQAGE